MDLDLDDLEDFVDEKPKKKVSKPSKDLNDDLDDIFGGAKKEQKKMRTIPSVANASPQTSINKKDDDFIDDWGDFTAEKKPIQTISASHMVSVDSKPKSVPPAKKNDDDGWGDFGDDSPRKGSAITKTLLGAGKKPLSRSSKMEDDDDLLDNVLD